MQSKPMHYPNAIMNRASNDLEANGQCGNAKKK